MKNQILLKQFITTCTGNNSRKAGHNRRWNPYDLGND
jgi:hypothetical protein